jgi:hypothetical protein
MMKKIMAMVVSGMMALVAGAQESVIAGYDFDDGGGNVSLSASGVDVCVTASDYGVGAGLLSVVNAENANSYYSALDAQGDDFGTANGFSFGGAQSAFGFVDMSNNNDLAKAITKNDYMSFTVTPDDGSKLNLTCFTFMARVNDLINSAERWALFSSVDGFIDGDQIEAGRTSVEGEYVGHVIDLSDERFRNLTTAIEFRLYIYGGSENASSATLFDKVILNGTVDPTITVLLGSSDKSEAVFNPVVEGQELGSKLLAQKIGHMYRHIISIFG